MLQWEAPAFDSPFELWREDGVLHLVLAKGGRMRVAHMKEILRLIAALDRGGRVPVMIDHAHGVVVEEDARRLLTRACCSQGHPLAVYSTDRECRDQLDVFRTVHRPAFPFRVFERREEAFRWARERRQLSALKTDRP